MENYFINPWIFYLIFVIDNFRGWATATFVTYAILVAISLVISMFLWLECKDAFNHILHKKLYSKLGYIIVSISIILTTFLPSSNTMIKMLIASQITTQNVEAVKKTIKESTDYVIEKLQEVDNKKFGVH